MSRRRKSSGPHAGRMQPLSLTRDSAHGALHSFPTRRSSDLAEILWQSLIRKGEATYHSETDRFEYLDRKSTRLNSSHANISYAVFCLKKDSLGRPQAVGGTECRGKAAPVRHLRREQVEVHGA